MDPLANQINQFSWKMTLPLVKDAVELSTQFVRQSLRRARVLRDLQTPLASLEDFSVRYTTLLDEITYRCLLL